MDEQIDCPTGEDSFSLSLVLPCFNEELNIERTIREAQRWFVDDCVDGQIVVTDDGSTDGSLKLLRRLREEMPNLTIVCHARNLGYGAAVRSGCDEADREWIAFMDSDGQFRAHDLRRLIGQIDGVQYITGIRQRRADRIHRRINGRLYHLLVRLLLGVEAVDINCGMKLFRRSIWRTIRPQHATGALINAEMLYAVKQAGICWTQTPVPHYPRLAGRPTGANLKVILRMFLELWQMKRARLISAGTKAAEAVRVR